MKIVAQLRYYRAALALALAVVSVAAWPAQAQDASSFKNKTVTLIVGFPPGGGYDTYSRLVARYFGTHLPGNPSVIVQNMPGAGGLVSMNHLYNVAPRDGTALAVVTPTAGIHQRLYPHDNVHYDISKVNWIGRIQSNVAIQYTWHESKFRTVEDMKARQVVVAGTGPTSASVVVPTLLNALAGTKFKVVAGYKGTSDAHLALERGEVEAVSTNWSSLSSDATGWLRDKKVIITMQFGPRRHPDLPNVPAVVELAKDESQRQIFEFFASADDIGVAIAAPPQLDPSVTATLRKAFDNTMRDPALLAEVAKRKIDMDILSGTELQQIAAKAFSTPSHLIEQAKNILEKQ